MRHITWYRLLAVGALVAPTLTSAQAPQPKLRQIASIPVLVDDAVLMPNGRVILYVVNVDTTSAIFAYDLASKRSTLVTGHCTGDLSVSPAGDRIAFGHEAEDGKAYFIATMPINPATGAAAGPVQRLSVGKNGAPNFSPDGKLIAFTSVVGAERVLAVVPAVGGPERVLWRSAKPMSPKAWSADGKWIFVEVGKGSSERSLARVPAQGGPAEALFSYAGYVASIDSDVAFYMDKNSRAKRVSRISYVTRSGERGDFDVPPGSQRARYAGLESGAKWLLMQIAPNTTGTVTSTVYELDVSPILQAIRKR